MDDLCAPKSEGVGLSARAISFQDFQPMLSWSTNVTDGRTDGRTTCDGNTALCTIVHRAVTRCGGPCTRVCFKVPVVYVFVTSWQNQRYHKNIRAVLSQAEPRDAAINFDMYRILQRHRAVSLPQYGFLVLAYTSDRSNAEITHSRPTPIFTAVTQGHGTRPKSR